MTPGWWPTPLKSYQSVSMTHTHPTTWSPEREHMNSNLYLDPYDTRLSWRAVPPIKWFISTMKTYTYHMHQYSGLVLDDGEHMKGMSRVLFHDTRLMVGNPNAWPIYILKFEHAWGLAPTPLRSPIHLCTMVPRSRERERKFVSWPIRY